MDPRAPPPAIHCGLDRKGNCNVSDSAANRLAFVNNGPGDLDEVAALGSFTGDDAAGLTEILVLILTGARPDY